ncbi:MAG: hypothetical protein Q8N16_00100 [bacterium]|nr:hypothetical protein [bacterium]
METFSKQKAWVVTVDMGYGHQRTANNLQHLAYEEKVICANNYEGMSARDRRIWEAQQKFYESVSAFKRAPLIGGLIFSILDAAQKVQPFYPKRDLSKPTLALRQIYFLLKTGWGRDLIGRLKKNPLPIISTFFTPAFMAEFFGYPGEIFCVVCDTDITRAWAPLDPEKSKIKYFAPTERVVERLKLYGVRPGNILLTGFPLPVDNIGNENLDVLKQDLRERISNLDPQKKFFYKYYPLIKSRLDLPLRSSHVLTLTFAVGGAGAQKKLAVQVLKSLAKDIKLGKIRMVLVAGARKAVKDYFLKQIESLRLSNRLGKTLEVLFSSSVKDYFKDFNSCLRQTDILWTKPSELSFYAALGLPIIIAPTIGSHEEFNKRWLLKSGFGIIQKDPRFVHEWLFDLVAQGYLAETAFEGFLEGEKLGAFNIQKIIEKCSGY